jgi:tetratricopeptide (TPR) repeat protein
MKSTRIVALTLSAMLAAALLSPVIEAQDAQASMETAKRHYGRRDYRAAIAELTRILELDPTRADALYLLGYSHNELRQYAESVEAFGRAFQADPTFDPRTIYQAPSREPM